MKTVNHTKKCEACGGNLYFSPLSNKELVLICEKCNSIHSIDINENIEKHAIEALDSLNNNEFTPTSTINCASCGASIVSNDLQFSSKCPYCGTNLVMNNASESSLKPDAIIPFKIAKDQIAEIYKKTIKRKRFLPNKLKKCPDNAHIEGFYFPAFGFDADTKNSYNGRLSRTSTNSNGKSHTTYFNISGNVDIAIRNSLVETSSQINQYELDELRPYNFAESVQYNPDFVRGYSVEHYENTLKNCYNLSKQYMKQEITDRILSKYSYDNVVKFNLSTQYSNEKYCYYLLPTYKLNFEFKKKKYTTYMNGQTGSIGSGMPKSKVKIAFTVILSILLVLLIVFLGMCSNN